MTGQRSSIPAVTQIADAALALVDEEGPDALTMRAVANQLGVATMTLYGHVAGKDALLDAMVDRVTADIADDLPDGTWEQQYAEIFRRLHHVMISHPGLVRLRLTRPFLSPGVVRLVEKAFDLLVQRGYTPEECIVAYRATYLLTLGNAAYVDHLDPAAAQQRTRTALASLDPADYPHMTGMINVIVPGVSGTKAFEYGLKVLVAHLAQRRP